MAKTTTEKPAKTKLVSSVKTKAPASKSLQKTRQPKATASQEASTLSEKAEGKRKSTAASAVEEEAPIKKSKKISEPVTEAVKATKETKKSKVQSKAEKKGKKGVEEEVVDSDSEPDAQVSIAKTSKKAAKSQKTSSKKAPKPAESDEEEGVQSAEEDGDGSDEEDVHLFGFSTDDEDSSDDEMNAEPDPVEITKLPTIAKDDAVVKQKLEKARKKPVRDILFTQYIQPNPYLVDCRPWCYLPRPRTTRFLRSSDEIVFFTVWGRNAFASVP